MSRAPLPAYARELADARRRGLTLRNPTVSVVLHGLRRPCVGWGVTVPDDRDPVALDWGFVRRLDVIVFRRVGDSPERLAAAIAAITRCQPRRLLVIDCQDPKTVVIVAHREARHAA